MRGAVYAQSVALCACTCSKQLATGAEGSLFTQTLVVVASATLGIVCLSRWLVYNGTVDERRESDRRVSVSHATAVTLSALMQSRVQLFGATQSATP